MLQLSSIRGRCTSTYAAFTTHFLPSNEEHDAACAAVTGAYAWPTAVPPERTGVFTSSANQHDFENANEAAYRAEVVALEENLGADFRVHSVAFRRHCRSS